MTAKQPKHPVMRSIPLVALAGIAALIACDAVEPTQPVEDEPVADVAPDAEDGFRVDRVEPGNFEFPDTRFKMRDTDFVIDDQQFTVERVDDRLLVSKNEIEGMFFMTPLKNSNSDADGEPGRYSSVDAVSEDGDPEGVRRPATDAEREHAMRKLRTLLTDLEAELEQAGRDKIEREGADNGRYEELEVYPVDLVEPPANADADGDSETRSAPKFEDRPVGEGASLRGRVAGARIVGGADGDADGVTVRLRTRESVNAADSAEPLFVVDGMITTAAVTDLDPDEIESIEVIKGATAVARYGARATQGVVMITTKR